VVLVELAVVEQRYRAVLEVLEGESVTEVARRFGVSRQTVHAWLNRYAASGWGGEPRGPFESAASCPHQMAPATEARAVALRLAHRRGGPDRIVYELVREQPGVRAPGRSSVYRALVRHGLVVQHARKRRRSDYRESVRSTV
jgi:transposase